MDTHFKEKFQQLGTVLFVNLIKASWGEDEESRAKLSEKGWLWLFLHFKRSFCLPLEEGTVGEGEQGKKKLGALCNQGPGK